jgi:transposase
MPSMQLRRDDVIVGVDTHKDAHVAVLLDGLGGRLGELFIPATLAGFVQLLAFCLEHVGPAGRLQALGVEGTGSYGIGLARFLRRAGHTVHEVHRPPRKGERRLSGKSDAIDAEHAARQVLTGLSCAVPKTADGAVESLRLLKIARDTAVKARTTAMITLKATLVTAADELRAELEPLTDYKLIKACATLTTELSLTDPDAAMRYVLGALARRWLQLHDEVKVHSRHLKTQTKAAGPRLVQAVGVGLDIAAEMLVTAGDNTDRVRSEAAFAKM